MKIHIENDPLRDEYAIHLFEKHNKVLYVAEPQEIKMLEVKNYKPFTSLPNLKPFLKVSGCVAMEFFAGFAKALAEMGYRNTDNEEEIKSILKATEFHLEDMRKLVFKKEE